MTGPSQAHHRAMHRFWHLAGITDRADRLALTGQIVGRHLASSNELTAIEALDVVDYLDRLHESGDLADRAAGWLARYRDAKTLVGKRNLSFESSVKWESSDLAFEYREDTKAEAKGKAGKIEVPKSFRIRLAPFVGAAPVELVARLRYDITRECLALGYQLTRPDRAEKEAFDRIVTQVGENTPEGVPVLFGTAPSPTR